jgi:hypothetical protein
MSSRRDYFQPIPVNTFRCPLCGSTAYDCVRVLHADGSILQTQAYQCGGTSVMFKDPKRFTDQKQVDGVVRHGMPAQAKRLIA